eukprot:7084054-Prymnesium_polylepis.1
MADALKRARAGPAPAMPPVDGAPLPVAGDVATSTALREAMSTGEVALTMGEIKRLLAVAAPSGVQISQCLAKASVIGLKRFALGSPSPVETLPFYSDELKSCKQYVTGKWEYNLSMQLAVRSNGTFF